MVLVSYMLSNLVGFFCELRNLALQLFFFFCFLQKIEGFLFSCWDLDIDDGLLFCSSPEVVSSSF